MARITVHPSIGIDMREIDFSNMYYGDSVRRTTSSFTVYYEDGFREVFLGSGFRYDRDGQPYSGTVTSYILHHGNDRLSAVEGVRMAAADIADAAASSGLTDDLAVIGQALAGADVLSGGSRADFFLGFSGNDLLNGNGGSDTLYGGLGRDTLNGGNGWDQLHGGGGADQLYGGAGNDLLRGGVWHDSLWGGLGSDRLFGEDGEDRLFGGADGDILSGGAGADLLWGEAGADLLRGGAHADRLFGGIGNDMLHGEAGADILAGGLGSDRLFGGLGADRFVFMAPADSGIGPAGRDVVMDFRRWQGDRLDLTPLDADLDRGGNNAFRFIGTEAFSGSAGELRYYRNGGTTVVTADRDGDGAADFAFHLQGVFTLQAGDFLL